MPGHLIRNTPQAYFTRRSEAQSAFILQLILNFQPNSSASTSFLVTWFGGRIDHLRELLVEERIPDGWEPVVRKQMGFTICSFAPSALKVELGVKDSKEE